MRSNSNPSKVSKAIRDTRIDSQSFLLQLVEKHFLFKLLHLKTETLGWLRLMRQLDLVLLRFEKHQWNRCKKALFRKMILKSCNLLEEAQLVAYTKSRRRIP